MAGNELNFGAKKCGGKRVEINIPSTLKAVDRKYQKRTSQVSNAVTLEAVAHQTP